MATAAPVQSNPGLASKSELDCLGEDFFKLAESQLGEMEPDERSAVIASIHATAERLRAEQ